MLPANAIALKEWAAVCAALESGEQHVLLRKGGIAEGPHGFRMEQPEFWLYPTQFHQDAGQLTPAGCRLLATVQDELPPPGRIRLRLYAVVEQVDFLKDWSQVEALTDRHILSPATVRQRFDYRTPGLYAARVRILRRASPYEIEELPRFAGCKSWVTLEAPLSTVGLRPIGS